jgi:hypothetical protein
MSNPQKWTPEKIATFYAAGELQEQQLCDAHNRAWEEAFIHGKAEFAGKLTKALIDLDKAESELKSLRQQLGATSEGT